MLYEYLGISFGGTTDLSGSSLAISAKIRGLDAYVLSEQITLARLWEAFLFRKNNMLYKLPFPSCNRM